MFRRVTRYRASATLDPRENRLTEVTAAALEHVDGLAVLFARCLLALGRRDAERRRLPDVERKRRTMRHELASALRPHRVQVETQVATTQGRYVDLELVLRPRPGAAEPGLLVWVEVKHGADLHGDQVDAYLNDIVGRHPGEDLERVVVLLGPRGWEPSQTVAEQASRADWQALAHVVRTHVAALDAPEQRWLLNEYIRYLKEEGLSDPDALTVSSALALMYYEQAQEAAAGICEHADAVVSERWGDRTDCAKNRSGDPTYGLGYWANYEPNARGSQPHERWGSAWFEWGLRYGPSLQFVDDRRGTHMFIAGAATYYAKDEAATRAGNEAWMGRRHADGFQRAWLDNYRLVRIRYPDELLVASSLEEQGGVLGQWIVDAFTALAADPPDV
jgi:hypothetical protein